MSKSPSRRRKGDDRFQQSRTRRGVRSRCAPHRASPGLGRLGRDVHLLAGGSAQTSETAAELRAAPEPHRAARRAPSSSTGSPLWCPSSRRRSHQRATASGGACRAAHGTWERASPRRPPAARQRGYHVRRLRSPDRRDVPRPHFSFRPHDAGSSPLSERSQRHVDRNDNHDHTRSPHEAQRAGRTAPTTARRSC